MKSTLNDNLIGVHVIFKISDPWDLGESRNWEPLDAITQMANIRVNPYYGNENEILLLKLNTILHYQDVVLDYMIASPRHANSSLNALIDRESVFCNVTAIQRNNRALEALIDAGYHIRGNLPPLSTKRDYIFDAEKHGLGMIGDIVVVQKN